MSLNDRVVEWGATNGANDFNAAKQRLTSGLSQDDVAVFAGASGYNEGLRFLAEGPDVLRDAVFLVDAAFSGVGEPRVPNRGTGGSVLDAKYGSVLGAYVYDGAAVLPGIIGNYLSVPDAAALRVTGDIELVARVASSDWTPATRTIILGRHSSIIERSYHLSVETSGIIQLMFSTDGTTYSAVGSSVAPTLSANTTYWIKATRNATTGAGNFFYAVDQSSEPASWTRIGSADVAAGSGSINAGTSPLEIGSRINGTETWNGSIYRTIVRNGIDGTTVLDVDMSSVDNYATSFTAATGQTVTVNTTTSDTNDPLLLTHTGENYVYTEYLNTAQSLLVPSAANLQLNTAMEFRTEFTATVTETVLQRHVMAMANLVGQRCYDVYGSAATFRYSLDGTNFSTLSGGSRTFTAGVRYIVEWKVDPTTGIWSYWEDDVQITGGTTTPWTNFTSVSEPLAFFGRNSSNNLGAKWHRFTVTREGAVVLDVDCATDITDSGATSLTATSGQTVTVNRATSGRKTCLVTRPIWLFGTDDYMEVADNALLDFDLTDDFTLMGVGRYWSTFASGRILAKAIYGGGASWVLSGDGAVNAVTFGVGGGGIANRAIAGVAVSGALRTFTGVRDTANNLLRAYANNTTGTATNLATATSANGSPVVIGGQSAGYSDAEFLAFAIWRRALTADEIAAINTYYRTV